MARKAPVSSQDFDTRLQKTPIAIIGMGSIFPQANNLNEYWDNILNKINCVTEVPPSRWEAKDYYDPDPSKPDKSYCKVGGFIPDIDFDPMEFGLPPNILEVTDVSQLLALVVAKEALEDAGYGEGKEFNRENTGVILGVVGVSSKLYVPLMSRLQYPVWEKVLKASGVSDEDTNKIIEKIKLAYVGWEENSFPGSLANIVAGRIANRFDLGGTNCVLDAACGTSLAAIRMAIMELVEGRMDMMITGGVDTDNSIGVYMSFSKTPAFSKGEAVRTFDADSDGMMAGEGLGMVVLKRLEDAERDGNRIYAVIRGIGSSSDGRFKSIYAPRPSGQAIALRRAYHDAGYSPATVGLIEAHGTGTPAGDPAEFQGLREVFEPDNPERQYIALGSVKSQIAHTKGAAGSAGLIKLALALHHKILPPTINVKKPNPKLDVENSPFYINTETRPWFRHDANVPRRAGVSAFGFGGTNFHVALEEYENEHQGAYRTNTVAQTVLLSAPTHSALVTACQDTLARLNSEGKVFYNQLVSASQSAQIPQGHARLGFVAGSQAEAQDLLATGLDLLKQKPEDETWEHPKGIYFRKSGMDPKGKVVALFSGQGSQYLEMGRELACNFPPIRNVFGEMDKLFVEDGLKPLSSRVYPAPVFEKANRDQLSETLTRTEHAQPAIGVIGVGLYKLLQQAGFAPDFVAGHSFGELTALWASGVLSDQDYYFLAKSRGKAMAAPDDPTFDTGTMLAVKGDANRVAEEIKNFPEITLANWNSDDQVVLAGSKPEIARVQQFLAEKGYSVIPLPVSAAFHTPLVGHAQKPFAAAIDSVKFNSPTARLYSNTSGKTHSSDPEEIRKVLKGHILNPVLFRDEINNIYAEGGAIFVEFGPKNVLTNLVKSCLSDRPHLAVALNANAKKDSDRQFREAVLQLRVAGMQLGIVDPYQAPAKAPSTRKKSPVTVKLNGGLYTSPKTVAAFENALKDGWKISSAVAKNPSTPASPVSVPQVASAQSPVMQPAPAPVPQAYPQPTSVAMEASPILAELMEKNLAQLREHQSEVVRLHEQYLRNEGQNGNTFAKLSELEIALVSNAEPGKLEQIVTVFEGLERSMARFHDHQADTLRVHEQYLKSQEEFSQTLVKLAQQQVELAGGSGWTVRTAQVAAPAQPVKVFPAAPERPVQVEARPVMAVKPTPAPILNEAAPAVVAQPTNGNGSKAAAAPSPAPAAAVERIPQAAAVAYDRDTLTKGLLKVVSDKTGYPVEMLELDNDMEADLGIDSIKRVEIMGEMRNQFPSLPKADPEAFAAVRTLGQTVEYMTASQPESARALPEVAVPPVVAQVPVPSVSPAPSTVAGGAYDPEILTQGLLKVVSDKTGYPVEMLELDNDMEADLGIDSIKRVEIMGELRNQFPDLPKADPEAFAAVRTLGQTVQYLMERMGGDVASPVQELQFSQVEPVSPTSNPPLEDTSAGWYSMETLTRALLNVVSEKTGYPVEMLELDNDMEADLGIDSIKRVEIMGELRNQFPTLPKADPEAFAEVRTLGGVISYLGARSTDVSSVEETAAETIYEPVDPSIQRGIVNLKTLPAPDFSDFSLPGNHICLIVDGGTEATAKLAAELSNRSWKVVVLSFPPALVPGQSPLPKDIQRVTLADMSEESLQQQLAEVSARFGPVGALIHLNPPVLGTEVYELYSATQKEINKQVFLMAKHLKDPLTEAARIAKSAFMVVVSLDGKFGLGNGIDFDPVSGGLFGLVKTLNLEWDAVYCRAVDISPELGVDESIRAVIAELHDPNRLITEVGYNPAGRSTLVVELPVAETEERQ